MKTVVIGKMKIWKTCANIAQNSHKKGLQPNSANAIYAKS